MTMRLKSLSEITYNIINNIHDVLPTVDTKVGTFVRDVFVDPVSNEIANLYEEVKLVELAQSILTATGNDLDALASNFFVTRKLASASSGKLRFYFDKNEVASAPNGELLVGAGTTISTQGSITTSPIQIVTASDALIKVTDSQSYTYDPNTNQYYVDIPAWSTTPGSAANIAINTAIVPVSSLDQAIISVTNPYPFQNGSDQESDASLALRVSLALLGANIGTKDGYLSFTLKQAGVQDALVVGAGDPLMTRDKGEGGMVDIYVRGEAPTSMTMQFTADVYYVTGTGAYLADGPYSDVILEYQPLIATIPNGSLMNDGQIMTSESLDVPSLVGTGLSYSTTYKNAANYSLEQGSDNYYLDYKWDFSNLNDTQSTPVQTTVNTTFPANTVVYVMYTYLSSIGETTPSPEVSITMDGKSSAIDVDAGILPPGAIGINVYVSTSSRQEILAGSSDYGASNFRITSIPSSQNPMLPPTANSSGLIAPTAGATLIEIQGTSVVVTSTSASLIVATADQEALNMTLFANPSGSGYYWQTSVGLPAMSDEDNLNLSRKLNSITTVSNIEYDVDFSQIQWYQVNQYNGSGTYAVVNGQNYYFDENFNIGVLPSDNNIYIIQVASGTSNIGPSNIPIPTAANRFFILNNNTWYERRYYQPDFMVYHDSSSTGRGTVDKGTRDSIRWLKNASQKPQPGEILTIDYNINQLVNDIQDSVETKRVLTADVMIKQAVRAGINIYIEVSPYLGYDSTILQQNLVSRLSNFITNLSGLGGSISKLDVIYIAKGTEGLQSMGTTSLKLSRTFNADMTINGQDVFEIDTQPFEYLDVDNIYVLVRPSGYVFNNV